MQGNRMPARRAAPCSGLLVEAVPFEKVLGGCGEHLAGSGPTVGTPTKRTNPGQDTTPVTCSLCQRPLWKTAATAGAQWQGVASARALGNKTNRESSARVVDCHRSHLSAEIICSVTHFDSDKPMPSILPLQPQSHSYSVICAGIR